MDATVHYHIDFESRSRVDLKARGLDNYAKDPSTEILMMAYACGTDLPHLWFPHVEPLPAHLELVLRSPDIIKHAFNVEFERTMLREVMKIETPIRAWEDAAVTAKYASIAGNLAFVGNVVGIDEDKKKLAIGKKLIKLFCLPNKDGQFNDWNSHKDEWDQFCEYCKNDVTAEREISRKLRAFALPAREKKIWYLDQKINARGIPSDGDFVRNASAIVSTERNTLTQELNVLTGLENPNSPKQLLDWLKGHAYPFGSLGAKWVTKALNDKGGVGFENSGLSAKGRRALELRQQLAKSSTAKLEAISNLAGPDGRLRYQYVYGGAARTLRWSGKGFQPHNLPRGTVKDVHGAVEAILSGLIEAVRKFGSPLEVVSSCLRSAIRAPKGKKFVVCDLGAIENRGLGWGAHCAAILDVFAKGLDPYVDFGTRLFRTSYESLDPELAGLTEDEIKFRKGRRQLCKPAVLGCGYGLGKGADEVDKNGDEIKTGLYGYAANMNTDITIEQSEQMVNIFRNAYPEVPAFWRKLESAAIAAVRTGELQHVNQFSFNCVKPCKLMFINLPSGRRLHYIRPNLASAERWDGEAFVKLSYEGNIIGNHWGRQHTWGGKLTENIVQALSRDILAHGMLLAEERGFTIVAHTHDELVCLEDVNSSLGIEQLRECMITRPEWALDLPLDAEGFEDEIYRKN